MSRLLAISTDKLVLLSAKTKLPLLSVPSEDLCQWSSIGHEGLVIEFRAASKWTILTPSVDSLKQLSMALWEVVDVSGSGVGAGIAMLDNVHRDILDFGKSQWKVVIPEVGVYINLVLTVRVLCIHVFM